MDVKTTFDTTFKLSDEEIICFDETNLILKKISMLKKEEDLKANKFFAKTVLKHINQA